MKNRSLILLALLGILTLNPRFSAAQTGKTAALETIGSLSGMLLYNTYLGIGSIGDGFEKDVYDADYVVSLMDEQIDGMNQVSSQIEALLSSGFLTDESDKDFATDLVEAFGLLSKQAAALKSYCRSLSEDDAENFQGLRSRSWTTISALLGLE